MNVSTRVYERKDLLLIAEALTPMVSSGSFTATLISRILRVVKEDKKR